MFKQYIMTDFKMRKIWDESVGIGSVPLFVICHIHFPHNLCQDQGSEFDHIYSSGQLLFNYSFLLPYQNFALLQNSFSTPDVLAYFVKLQTEWF